MSYIVYIIILFLDVIYKALYSYWFNGGSHAADRAADGLARSGGVRSVSEVTDGLSFLFQTPRFLFCLLERGRPFPDLLSKDFKVGNGFVKR